MQMITVKIDPLGNSTVDANGFTGQSCAKATDSIEKALAGTGSNTRQFKLEWALPESTQQEVHEKIGF